MVQSCFSIIFILFPNSYYSHTEYFFVRVVRCAGPRGHILNLGHGVLVGTPEEAVAHFFEVARTLKYDAPQNQAVQEPKLVA